MGGGPAPAGPLLVVANHPNSLLDPIMVFRATGRVARPLAKAPLFEHPLVGPMLRALGGLPVFRRQDDPALMERNEGTFDAAIAALHAGEAVQIFPEGITHSEPGLAPLRTGAARIALLAEARAGWRLGLRILPVGLTYRRKTLFRGRAAALLGQPLTIEGMAERWAADPEGAVRELTATVTAALEAVTLNLTHHEDAELVDAAERLHASERGHAGPREARDLAARVPRMRRFAEGLAWLRAHDPERHRRLAARVRRYARLAGGLGAGEGDVPTRYRGGEVARWLVREGGALLLGLPLAAAGTAFWYLPYLGPRLLLRLARPHHEAVSSYKLSAAVVLFPLWLAAWTALAWRWGGSAWGVAVLVAAPLTGLAAIAWMDRAARVREDAGLFLRVLLRRRTRERLAAERAALAAEFDGVAEAMERAAPPTAPSPPAGSPP